MAWMDREKSGVESKVDAVISNVKDKGRRGISHVIFGRTIISLLLIFVQVDFYRYLLTSSRKSTTLYLLLQTIAALIVAIIIINEEMNPVYKLGWLIPVIALPVYGVPLYIFARIEVRVHVRRIRLATLWQKLSNFLEQRQDVARRLSEIDKDSRNTSKYLYNTLHFPVYDNTDAYYYPSGEAGFRHILAELERAKEFIFLEFFIIDEGVMWDAILEILKAKVKEGVEVRVMYDGTNNFKVLPYSYPKTLESYGIKVRVFSPIVPVFSFHQNNRDHRKILVVDGKVCVTGGVNLADEYINEVNRFGYWKDNVIILKGEAVKSYTAMFLQLWNLEISRIGRQDKEIACYFKNESFEGGKGFYVPYGDSPLDKENTGEQVYLDIINQAEYYVHIMTPYLILDNEMLMTLKNAAKRGVDVKIIMPHIPDKKFVFYLAHTYYKELSAAGVKIYEFKPGFVHSKVFVSDNIRAVVGTINLDYRSLFLHYECAVYMHDTRCINDVISDFNTTLNQCILMGNEEQAKFSKIKLVIGRILRIISPLL